MEIKTFIESTRWKKNPNLEKKIQIYINFSRFFKFWVYVPIFSGLGFNFRVKWFMGLCPYFPFFRVKFSG